MTAATAVVCITLNGERHHVQAGTRLADVLRGLDVDVRRIAVERNREIVPRAQHEGLVVADGDVFEVVHFVGGG